MLNDVNLITRTQQWDQKQGGDGITVDGWVFFSNGACRERNPMGCAREPDPDLQKRAKDIVFYHEEVLRRATVKFKETKEALLTPAKFNLRETLRTPEAPNTEQALATLKQLRADVALAQVRLDEARANLVLAKPQWQVEQEERAARNRQANEEYIAAIDALKI